MVDSSKESLGVLAFTPEATELHRRIMTSVSNDEEAAELKCMFVSDDVSRVRLESFLTYGRLDPVNGCGTIDSALHYFKKALEMRAKLQIRDIFDKDFFPDGFAESISNAFGPQIGGSFADGTPLMLFDMGRLDYDVFARLIKTHGGRAGETFAVFWLLRAVEYQFMELFVQCSIERRELTSMTHIVLLCRDFNPVNNWGRHVANTIARFVSIGNILFPYGISNITLLHAPRIASYICRLTKPLLDPTTANKINVLCASETARFIMQADPSRIPECLSGTAKNNHQILESRYPTSKRSACAGAVVSIKSAPPKSAGNVRLRTKPSSTSCFTACFMCFGKQEPLKTAALAVVPVAMKQNVHSSLDVRGGLVAPPTWKMSLHHAVLLFFTFVLGLGLAMRFGFA